MDFLFVSIELFR